MSRTKIKTDWVLDNWVGILINYTGKFGERSVLGWECKHCGARLGTSGLPPRKCINCGYNSSEEK